MKPLGRPRNPKRVVKTIRTNGLFFNDRTGNLHRTVKIQLHRADGSIDHGDMLIPAGAIPEHPTTGEPLEDCPGNRGLRINPKPAGSLVRGSVVITDRVYDGHGNVRMQTYINVARYAWWRQTGERLPKGKRLIHLDGDPWNNHVSNLQVVQPVETRRKARYQAATRISGVRVSLRYFETRKAADEAVNAFRLSVGAGPVRAYNRKPVTTADTQSATL